MPASMAGSRGGAIGISRSSEWTAFVTRLLAGDVTYPELAERLLGETRPRTVTLVVNNTCNLRCAHCYLQVERLSGPVLREPEWHRLFESLNGLGPELVCLSGKEVFVDSLGISLLEKLCEERVRVGASYRTGVITNGSLISRYRERIATADPSYLDISLDGIEEDHDAVRGRGAFARAWPNVLWAAETFGDRFFVNLTMQRRNYPRLLDTVRFLASSGVRNVELGFYIQLPYASPALALSNEEVDGIMSQLGDLALLPPGTALTVHLDLDTLTFEPLLAFLRSRWFSPESLTEDSKGELFVSHCFPNGVALEVRLAPFPVGVSRSVRITPEGNYLAAEDTVDTRFYVEASLGNVRDFDFDLARLHATTRVSARHSRLLRRFFCDQLPTLVAAFRSNPSMTADRPAGAAA